MVLISFKKISFKGPMSEKIFLIILGFDPSNFA